jgi:hypothetical protein
MAPAERDRTAEARAPSPSSVAAEQRAVAARTRSPLPTGRREERERPRRETSDARPTIRVDIGRIEVRGAPPVQPVPEPPQAAGPEAMSLDAYLDLREGGRL